MTGKVDGNKVERWMERRSPLLAHYCTLFVTPKGKEVFDEKSMFYMIIV